MKERSRWLIFGLMAMAQFMVILDTVVANVALPIIKETLHFSDSSLQWVVTAYALAFGGFLLLGGRAADLFGRRRVLLTGMVGFTIMSLLIGFSQNEIQLITFRVLQGLSAALMSPAALSMVLTAFQDERERTKALSLWTIVAAGGGAMGLLLGGILTQYLDWRWNFFINVPIGLVVAWGIYKFVPKHASEERSYKHLDLPGALLVTSGLISFVYAAELAVKNGWTNSTALILFAASALLMVLFVVNEARSKHPLVPLSIFKVRNVTVANLILAPVAAGMMGMFFLTSLYMQIVMHLTPLQIGLAFLPFPIIIGVLANRMPKLIAKYGFKLFLVTGLIITGVALAWLTRLPVEGSYVVDLLPTILLLPLGMGMIFTPLFTAATSGVPPREAGLASGLISTAQQMGGALGLAIITGIAASAAAAATNLAPMAALVHGYRQAFMVTLAFIVVALILSITLIKQPKKITPLGPEIPTTH
jgi:EmrB/QacA subfamily drug resistance transporter